MKFAGARFPRERFKPATVQSRQPSLRPPRLAPLGTFCSMQSSLLSRMVTAHALACVALFVAIALPASAAAQSARASTTSRLIVKLRAGGAPQAQAAAATRVARFATDAALAGVALTPVRAMTMGAHVMALDRPHSRTEVEAVVARLSRHPDVDFVAADFLPHA